MRAMTGWSRSQVHPKVKGRSLIMVTGSNRACARPPRARWIVALAAAVGLTAAVAPSAQAAFTTPVCGGSAISGRGASFQAGAQSGFNQNFHSAFVCGAGGPGISYDPAGSGPGRAAFGEGAGTRDPSIRYIAFDEAPTPSQRTQIEQGGAGAGDDGSLHVIPAAIGAVPIIVNFPNNCTIPAGLQDKPDGAADDTQATQRFLASTSAATPTNVNQTWEKAWEGDSTVDTWGELVPGISGAGCAALPIKRVVRSSSSGTTFGFKKWLKSVAPTVTWEEPGLANTAWPNDTGATAVLRPGSSGNGPLAALVNSTDGSIGYGDLKTDRDNGFNKTKCTSSCPAATAAPSFDDTFWVRVKNGSGVLQDPQKETVGYKDNTLTGANCDQATIAGIPGGADPTLGDWSQTSAAASPAGYAVCTPTYLGVWDDNSTVYGTSQAEQDKFRTVVDYAKSIVSPAGQATLSGRDYNSLPLSLLGAAGTGVNALDWNKAGGGGGVPPGGGGGGGVTPPPSGGGGGTTTPPPSAATASLSIASATVARNAAVTLSARVSGAGTLSGTQTASVSSKDFKSAKNKTLTVAKLSLRVSRAGSYKLVFKPSAKAKRILAKRHKLKVSIKVTFTPASGGGNPVTKTVTLTIKAKKKKK